jgi:O-antigen ligase/tetratricopeptide (TPR) repeat protein
MKTTTVTGRKPVSEKAAGETPLRWGRGILFLHLLLSPLFFWRDSIDPFDFQKLLLLKGSLLLLAGLWLWRGLPGMGWQSVRTACREPITLGMVLYWCSALLSTIFSINPSISWQGVYFSYSGLGTVTAYTALFLATRWLIRSQEQARGLLVACVVAGAVAAGYAVVQWLRLDPLGWSNSANIGAYNRPFGTLGHANLLAAYLAMTFPFAVYGSAQAWGKGRRLLCVVVAGVALLLVVALMLTLCRGGWLAWLVSLPLLALGYQLHRGLRGPTGRYVLGSVVVGMMMVAVFLAWGPAAFRQSFTERWEKFSEPSGRFELWRAAWAIFQEHPVTGSGLETFALTFPPHRSMAYWQIEGNLTHNRAHNEPLHILATQGILGLAAWLLIGYGLARTIFRLWRSSAPTQRAFLLTVAAALVAFYVQNFFFFTMTAYGTLFVTLAAILANLGAKAAEEAAPTVSSPATSFPVFWQWGLRVSGGFALVFVFWSSMVLPAQADSWSSAGNGCLREQDPVQAAACFQQALVRQPNNPFYAAQWGTALEQAGMKEPNPQRRHAWWQQAQQAYGTAARLVPQDAAYHAGQARVWGEMAREGLAEPQQALTAYDRAIQLDPNNVQLYVDASRVALENGNLAQAAALVQRGLARAPRFGPLCAQQAVLALRQNQVAEALALLQNLGHWDWTGEGEGLLQARCAKAEALVRLQRYQEAVQITRSLNRMRPDWSAPCYLEALALEGLGRWQEAVRHYHNILRAEPHHGPARQRLQHLQAQTHHQQ